MKNIRLIALVSVISNQTVRVQWESQFVDHFETGDFSLFDWNNAVSDYPWEITDSQSFDGSFSMRASNAGIDNSTSAIQIIVVLWQNLLGKELGFWQVLY